MKKIYSVVFVVLLSIVTTSVFAQERQRRERPVINPATLNLKSLNPVYANQIVANENIPVKDFTRASDNMYAVYYCNGYSWLDDEMERCNWLMGTAYSTTSNEVYLKNVIPNFIPENVPVYVEYKLYGNTIVIEPQKVLYNDEFDIWFANEYDKDGLFRLYIDEYGNIYPEEDDFGFYVLMEKNKPWSYYDEEEYIIGDLYSANTTYVAVEAENCNDLFMYCDPSVFVHLNVADAKVTAKFEIAEYESIYIEDETGGLNIITDDYFESSNLEVGTSITGSIFGVWSISDNGKNPSLVILEDDDYSPVYKVVLDNVESVDVSKGNTDIHLTDIDWLLANINCLVTITNSNESPIYYNEDHLLTVAGEILVKNFFDEDYLGPDTVESITGILTISSEGQLWLLPRSEEDIVAGSTSINDCMESTEMDAPVYNLAGQKVGAEYKGIVIKNGKASFVK